MTTIESNPNFSNFAETWRQSFAQALTDAASKPVKVEFLDAKSCAEPAANAGPTSYRLTINAAGNLRGMIKFVMSEADALQLSALAASAAGAAASQFGDAQRNAVTQLIGKAAGKVIAQWGSDKAKLSISSAPAESGGPESACGGLRVSAEKLGPITILLIPSADFMESLENLEKPAAAVAVAKPTKSGAPMSQNQPAAPASNLGLLFDVQLEATIRFGGRQLLLRDILSLSPGSVIELDRQVNEPAELLVAGRLVARGEVVVVDGNFGLRVTELSSAAQRGELVQA